MIKKLIDMGADVNYAFKNLQRNPPLQSLFHSSLLSFSILLGNAEAAKILIQANANIDGNINREISLIEFATQMGNPGVLRAIIEKKKERVKDPEALLEELLKIWEKRIETIESEPRFDTLSLASFFGYTHVVEWFLSLSNYQHNFTPFGLSPLHLAVLGGHKEIVEILLRDRKWSVQKYFSGTLAYDAPGIWGLSPFHIAAHMGNYSLVNIFINHNPEPYILPEPFEVENFDCRSPLDMAAMQGHTKIVKLLIPQLSSPDHPLSIPTSELVPQLMELANRAKLDGAPSLLLMAMKEKNVVLANILHGGKYPLLEPGDSSEWMKEFFHPLSTGELETNTKSDNNSGFLPNHSTSAKVYLPNFLHGLPIPSRTTSYNSRGLFTLAAHLGDMELIKKWKPNKTRQMNTPLYVTARYIAALQGHESVVMNLASLDESQVMDDDERKYALEYAAGGGHFQLTSNLLKLGSPALLNYALLAACFRGNIAVVNLLLDNGANLESFNKIRVKNSYFCGNALQAAAYRGNLELVRELLARGAKVDASVGADQLTKPTPGEWGALGVNKLSEFVAVTALHIALDYRHEVVAIELIQAGAKTKIDNNPLEATSLFFACKRGLTEVVKICLERDNYHPLVFRHMLAVAAFHGHLDVAKELMNRVDLTEDELRDPFPFAVAGGNVEIVKMMLERGSKISSITQVAKMVLRGCVTKSINDTIPFFIPVQKGNVEMVELLLDNGVEVDLKDSKGYCTALMYAASIQSSTVTEMVKLLVDRGADVNHTCPDTKNSQEQVSSVKFAIKNDNLELISYLVQNGASLDFSGCGFHQGKRIREELLNEKYGQDVVGIVEKEVNSLDFAIRQGYFYATQLIKTLLTGNKTVTPGKLLIGRFRTRAEIELMFKGFKTQSIQLTGIAELIHVKTPYWLVLFSYMGGVSDASKAAHAKNKTGSARSHLKFVPYGWADFLLNNTTK